MSPTSERPGTSLFGPDYFRKRAAGLNFKQRLPSPVSPEFVRNIKQESILDGHSGCVNCLEWSHDGTLLASGSDDRQVIIWNPFQTTSCCHTESRIFASQNDTSRCKRHVVKTNHTDNIFSVKFVPSTSNYAIATCASDAKVLLTDVLSSRELRRCSGCHCKRVKRLANHANEPQLLWSAGEDGLVIQHDLRVKHTCQQNANALIDLNRSESLAANCLAINPVRDEMIAIGCDDLHIRLFDRRSPRSPILRFVPGHLKANRSSRQMRTFGTTYLSFSPDGAELLANLHAEQVYLFSIYGPCESFKSLETNLKPLILDKPTKYSAVYSKSCKPERIYASNPSAPFKTLEPHEKTQLDSILTNLQSCSLLKRIDTLNDLIDRLGNLPELYLSRSSALMERDWRGDIWQAFRDCCRALSLRPLDYQCISQLAEISYRLQNKDIANGMLDIMRSIYRDTEVTETCDRMLRSKLSRFISLDDIRMDEYYNDKPLAIEITTDDQQQSACDSILSDLIARQNQRSRQNLMRKSLIEYDYSKRYTGHCNMNTDIKEANFFGSNGEYIVAGSDDGAVYIWDKNTTNLVKAMHADSHILNCVQPHPTICMLATSGIDPTVKIWSTSGSISHDILTIEERCTQNQNFITADPLEAMVMMLYTEH